jgi:tape measure domain-containing protein
MTGIVIESRADTSQAQKEINRLNDSLKNTEDRANKAGMAMATAFKLIGVASTIAFSMKYFKEISNEFAYLENRIATVTGRTKELVAAQQDLFDLSKETKSSIRDSTELYAQMGLSLKAFNVESQRLVKITGTVQKAITLSGANKIAAQNAIIQLGQGLSAGVLRGDELRSVIEQTPRLALAIADTMNTTIGGLRRLGAEGRITSEIVFNALIQQAEKINEEFKDIKPTMEQASTAFGESIRLYINEFGKGLGIFDRMAQNSFDMAERIKVAAENAFDLGNKLRVMFLIARKGFRDITESLLKPLLNVFKEFSINILAMLPRFAITNTLKNDAIRAMRWLDDNFFMGLITRWRRWQIMSLFMIESDLEKALRRLRRLNPRYLIGGGFNRPTLEKYFSMEYVREYGNVLADVAKGIRKNRLSLNTALEFVFVRFSYLLQKFERYFGFRMETMFTLKRGVFEPFFRTLNQGLRGLTFTSIKWIDFSGKTLQNWVYLLQNNILPSYIITFKAFAAAVGPALKKISDGVMTTFSIILRMFKMLLQIGRDFVTQFSLREALSLVLYYIDDFIDRIRYSTWDLAKAMNPRVFTRLFKDLGGWMGRAIAGLDFKKSIGYFALDLANNFIAAFLFMVNPLFGVIAWAVGVGMEIVYLEVVTNSKKYSKFFKNFGKNIGKLMSSAVNVMRDSWKRLAKGLDFSGLNFNFGDVVSDIKEFGLKIADVINMNARSVKTAWKGFFKNDIDVNAEIVVARFELFKNRIIGAFKAIPKYITTLLYNLNKKVFEAIIKFGRFPKGILANISQNLGESLLKDILKLEVDVSTFDKIRILFKTLIFQIAFLALAGLSYVVEILKEFGKKTIAVFADIYDQVIGNSYWTDTIEEIVRSAGKLWNRISKPLNDVRKGAIDVFKDIFDEDFGFNKETLLRTRVKITDFAVDQSAFKKMVNSAVTYILDAMALFVNTFPQIFKLVFLSLGAILVNILFPKSKMKSTLLAIMIAAMSRASFHITNELGKTIFGPELFVGMGRAIGTQIGLAFKEFASNIITIIGTIGGIGAAFVRGVAEELPFFLGTFFRIFYKGMSLLGLENLFSLALAGGAFKLFRGLQVALGLTGKDAKKATTLFAKLTLVLNSLSASAAAAKLSIGAIFSPRIASLALMIVSAFGGLDSMFKDSPLAKILVDLGLLAIFLRGPAWDGIRMGFQKKVLVPIGEYLRKLAPNVMKSLFNKNTLAKGSLVVAAVKGFTLLINKIASKLAIPFAFAGNFLQSLLFGSNPSATIAILKTQFKGVFESLSALFKSQGSKLGKTLQDVFSRIFPKKNKSLEDPFYLSRALKSTARTRAMTAELRQVQSRIAAVRASSGVIAGATPGESRPFTPLARADEPVGQPISYFSDITRQNQLRRRLRDALPKVAPSAAKISKEIQAEAKIIQDRIEAARKGPMFSTSDAAPGKPNFMPLPMNYYADTQALKNLQKPPKLPPSPKVQQGLSMSSMLGARLGGPDGFLGKWLIKPSQDAITKLDAMTKGQGLMGRAMIGPKGMAGIAILITTALGLFSTAARAADTDVIKATTGWDMFTNAIKGFVDSNPLITFSIMVGAIGAVFLSLIPIVARVKGVIATLSVVATVAGGALGFMFGGGLLGGITSAMTAAFFSGGIAKILEKVMNFVFAKAISLFLAAGSKITLAVLGVFTATFVAVAAAVSLLGALAWAWLFGDSEKTFIENVKAVFVKVINSVRSLFGLEDIGASIIKGLGLEKGEVEFLESIGIKLKYDLEAINPAMLSEKERAGLNKRIAEFREETQALIDKGDFSQADIDVLAGRAARVTNYVNRMDAKSLPNPEDIGATIDNMVRNLGSTNYGAILAKRQQRILDRQYEEKELPLLRTLGIGASSNTDSSILNMIGSRFNILGPGPVRIGNPVPGSGAEQADARTKLADLRNRRDTEFNAVWRQNFRKTDQLMIDMVESQGNVQYTHSNIVRDSKANLAEYLKVRSELARKETFLSPTFNYNEDLTGEINALKVRTQLLVRERKLITARIRIYDEQRTKIQGFQTDFNTIIEGFQVAGVSFGREDFIAEEDFFQTKLFALELKRLEEQFKATSDVTERNTIAQRMGIIKDELTLSVSQARVLRDSIRDVFQVAEEANRVLGTGFSPDAFENVGDEAAARMIRRIQEVERYRQRLRSEDMPEIANFGTAEDRAAHPLGAAIIAMTGDQVVPANLAQRIREMTDEQFGRYQYLLEDELKTREEKANDLREKIETASRRLESNGEAESRTSSGRLRQSTARRALEKMRKDLAKIEAETVASRQNLVEIRDPFVGDNRGLDLTEIRARFEQQSEIAKDLLGLKESANIFGFNLNNAIQRIGQARTAQLADALPLFTARIAQAEVDNNPDELRLWTKALEAYLEALNRAPKGFSEVASAAATFGFEERDFLFMSEKEVAQIKAAVNLLDEAAANIANNKNDFSQANVTELFRARAQAEKDTADALNAAYQRSPVNTLVKAGISDNAAILRLGADRERFISLYSQIQAKEKVLARTSGREQLELAQELLDLRRESEQIVRANDRKTFGGQVSAVNSIFGTNLTESIFSSISLGARRGLAALAGLVDNITRDVGEFAGESAEAFYDALRPIANRIKQLGVFAEIAENFKNALYRGADEGLQLIQNALSKLGVESNISEIDYTRIDPQLQMELENLATAISGIDFLARQRVLPPGIQEILSKSELPGADLEAIFAELEDEMKEQFKTPTEKLVDVNDRLIERINALIVQLGGKLPDDKREESESPQIIPAGLPLSPLDGRSILQSMRERAVDLQRRTTEAIPEAVNRAIALAQNAGVSLDRSQATVAGGDNAQELERRLTEALAARQIRDRLVETGGEAGDIRAAELAYTNAVISAERFIENNLWNSARRLEDIGRTFTTNMLENVKGTIGDVMKNGEPGDALKDLALNFSHQIIDSFVEGLMSPIFEGEAVQDLGKELGTGVFNIGRRLFGNPLEKGEASSDFVGPPAPDAGMFGGITDFFSNMTMTTAGAISGVGVAITAAAASSDSTLGMIIGLITTIAGILLMIQLHTAMAATASAASTGTAIASGIGGAMGLALATGGHVRGPGSETSDSIPAMLSNNEFVVNARSTKKHLGLLHQINQDKVKKFAEGGSVSSSTTSVPVFKEMNESSSGRMVNHQTINLNITGDVSRQTRSTVMRMIPEVATGVNGHNKETGHKG